MFRNGPANVPALKILVVFFSRFVLEPLRFPQRGHHCFKVRVLRLFLEFRRFGNERGNEMLLFEALPLYTLEERVLLQLVQPRDSSTQTRVLVHVQKTVDEVRGVRRHVVWDVDISEEHEVLGRVVHSSRGEEAHLALQVGSDRVVIVEGLHAGQQLVHRYSQTPPVHRARISTLLAVALTHHNYHLYQNRGRSDT